MKKVFSFIIILSIAFQCKSQFVNSLGITVGVSAGNQKFFFFDPNAISRKKYVFGFNASVFGEFFTKDHARWVSEFQFNQKGAKDKEPEGTYRNKLQYICWNNYLKLRYETYSMIPYILIGPRLEYRFTQSIGSPSITNGFRTLHVSGAVGLGTEFISFTNFKFLVEAFYNPDIMSAEVQPGLHVKNKNLELRIGVKYEFAGRKERCNTPTYVE